MHLALGPCGSAVSAGNHVLGKPQRTVPFTEPKVPILVSERAPSPRSGANHRQ